MIDFNPAFANFEKAYARGQFRFAVGSPETGYSAPWLAFPNNNDFYIGSRCFLGSLKISLHASGINRVALTEGHMVRMREQGLALPQDRAFVKWKRPAVPEVGAVPIVVLTFPTNFLRSPEPPGTARKPLVTFASAPPGKAVQVGFFLSRETPINLEPKLLTIGYPLLRTEFDDGSSISIVAREADFDDKVLPASDRLRGNLKPLDREGQVAPGSTRKDLTMMIWNAPKDGEHLDVIEVGGVTLENNTEVAATIDKANGRKNAIL